MHCAGRDHGLGTMTALARTLLAAAIAVSCGGGGGGGEDHQDGGGSDGGIRDSALPTPDSSNPGETALLPLAVGRSWTYQVTQLGSYSTCATGSQTESVTSQSVVGGRAAFDVSSWCSASGTNTLSVNGDQVSLYYGGAWNVILDVPVEEGHSWTVYGTIQYTWHDAGTVTVPAGTFTQCWRREQVVSYTAYTIFCRGVGAVRDYSADLNGSGWDAQLASKSF